MTERRDQLSDLSPEEKRKLLAKLLKEKAHSRSGTLSYGQRALWLLNRLEPESASYNVPWTWWVRSHVDVDALRRAFQSLVDRHAVLRTNYVEVNGQPALRVHDTAVVDFEQIAAAGWSDGELGRRVSREAHVPFDLERQPVLRVRLFTRSDRESVLLVTLHHIAYDLWSMMTLLHELGIFYSAAVTGHPPSLPPVRAYGEFVQWQADMLAGAEGERLWNYWRTQMAGDIPVLALPVDRPRPAVQTSSGATYAVRIPEPLGQGLRDLAQATGHTLFTLLLSAFEVLLARYAGEDDIVVGSPMTGRTRPEFQDVVGYCLNTVPLRGDLSGDPAFTEVLRRMRQSVLGALEHQDYPFALLVEKLRPRRDPGHATLFHAMFALNKPHRREDQSLSLSMDEGAGELELGGLVLEFTQVAQQAVVDDLVLLMSDVDESLGCRWQYNTDLFDESTIVRMAGHYERLLESVVADPQARISELAMMTAGERTQVVSGWNATARPYPAGSIAEVFEAQASQRPEHIAATAGDERLSYGELNRRANQLSHYLIEAGVGPDVIVGLFVERSLDMVVGLLGILKAGGAYLPLDPTYPKDRLAFMMQDAGMRVLLTESRLLEGLPDHRARVVCLDADWPSISRHAAVNPPHRATADHLAYVTYTSGSTGIPKGVEVRQRGVTRLLFGVDYVRLDAEQRFLQLAPVSFDASTLEIWGALLHGGTLALFTERAPTPQALEKVIARDGTTVLWLTASLFNSIIDARPQALSGVRQLLIGGEALSVAHVKRAQAALPGTQIINGYGPTESTTFTCCYPIPRIGDTEPVSIPIGGPIGNTEVYVLDARMEPVPVGVTGELYTGGDGLARGYMNRPALTAERFVPHPLGSQPGARLYRTGDLVRWRRDGTIAFVGRADSQVKIRGFRIEPGEVEAVLKQHPAVRNALVDVRELPVAGRSLVAYVVPHGGAESMTAVRDSLRDRLPDYMVPSVWVVLDAMPLTPNGKVDRAALPAPEGSGLQDEEFVAPQTTLESQIAQVWRDVLRVDRVGTCDSFFDLGGHSLLLVQAHSKLTAVLQRDIPITDLFRFPTVASLARHLSPDTDAVPRSSRAAQRAGRRSGSPRDEAIAVIAMAGRFPGAPDLETFWSNLRGGVESITRFTDVELRDAGVDERLLQDPRYVRARAVMDGVDLFDAAFFGYNPRDAELVDPQQRIFLECASEALERAGYDPDRYDGAVGVYAGSTTNGYLFNVLSQPGFVLSVGGLQALIGAGADFLTTRVSYKLNLRGPSVTVQTACSTSLVAVHHACRSLFGHECDIALAGGVSVGVPVVNGHLHQEGGILSPDGHCRAFDAEARGTVTGHGVGVVVLKRLADAVADGDTIHAVIRGTAINNDGSAKVGYTAPSVEGQAEVIALAQASAGVEPSSISYVEAHGTGTSLGDPIELAALTDAFGGQAPAGTCAIGSLKTNVGHLDAAAGVASLIKTVLALEHGEIPPSLHFQSPNPKIDFGATPFFVNRALTPWTQASGSPRRAGVSSFGIGGTNAHVVLQEAPEPTASSASRPWQLLLLSAKTRSALETSASQLAEFLSGASGAALPDIAYTLNVGRRIFAHRRVVVARDAAEAALALTQPEQSGASTSVAEPGERSCVFMFSGQGAQYAGMARDLYEAEPSFRADVDAGCELLRAHLGWDLRDVLTGPATPEVAARLKETAVTQPALFVIEYALAQLWMRWGIRPTALIGHSVGEYVAACLAGVFSLEAALALVAARGRLMQALPAGAMAAVALPEAELTPLLGTELSLAAVNGPALCVVAGPDAAITAFETRLSAQGTTVRRLETSHAFHSAMMEPALDAFRAEVARVARNAPTIPFISNVTGTWITAAEATSPEYWTKHLRQAVRFSAGVHELLQDPTRVFLEVGPGRTLASLVRQQGALAQGRTIVTSLRHPQETTADLAGVLQTLGCLWLAGLGIAGAGFYKDESRRRVPLPTYPFERQRYWIDAPKSVAQRELPPLEKADVADWFYVPSWKQSEPVSPASLAAASRWLVFAESSDEAPAGIGRRAARYLGGTARDLTIVSPGDRFVEGPHGSFTIDPGNADHYRALLETLKGAGRLPDVIGHFWGVTTETPAEPSDSETCQRLGFYSLLYLAQALGESGSRAPIRIGVVTTDLHNVTGDEMVCPSKATVLGLCRVIPAEYPQISCRVIDVAASEWLGENGAIADLISELASDSTDAVVARRRGRLWMPVLEATRFDAPDKPAGGTPSRLRDGGVYLITGGLGGVGLTLAESLARSVRARLVLTGRTGLPDRSAWAAHLSGHSDDDRVSRQIRAVEAIEKAGGEVEVIAADVSIAEQVQSVVDRAQRRFGRLDGVIHSAGVAAGGVIQIKTREIASRVLAPKVAGTQALARALDGIELDFFVLCSSMTSFFGGGGQADYCAANAYLDAFAAYYTRRTGTFTVAVNWDTWQQVGMAVEAEMPGDLGRARAERLKVGISSVEGFDAFTRILARSTSAQVAISTVSLPALIAREAGRRVGADRPIDAAPEAAAPSLHPRPEIATDYTAPINEIERAIAEVWQQLLGIDHVGREDNFFDLGGHSLLLVQAHAALVAKLGRTLPVTDLFQFPTIHSLAAHLGGGRDAVAPRAVERRSGGTSNSVAVVGMAGRFPGAADLDAFWANLRAGVESIHGLSDDDLRKAGVEEHLLANPRYVKVASTLDGVDLFDAGFFGYAPREAELIDPQHRVFLECAWEALERAGYDPRQYAGLIGVYAGAGWSPYLANIFSNTAIIESVGALQAGIGNRGDHLPTRVSYKLNLRGPSLNVQTACSTSLVAVHQACRSLVDGECDMALAGGVSIGLSNRIGYLYMEEGISSPDGHCRAFDAQARGTVWGDGVGVVVLKRLDEAVADGDTIHAVIRGTAINNDGAVKVGYTAPSVEGQAAVVARAQAVAGVDPATVSYIEAHGTGTTLGDPIEVAALMQAFGPVAPGTVAIGTVKTNFGHLDAAAGIASLIKTVLALEHGELPPSLNYESPNPKIDFAASPFFVNAVLMPWAKAGDGGPRRAGVSSFGIGGTNAHAVLEEAPPLARVSASRAWQLLVLSAQSKAALNAASEQLSGYLAVNPGTSLPDVAYTLQVGRRGFAHRRVLVARDASEAAKDLTHPDMAPVFSAVVDAGERSCVFMFSGQGAQYAGMARELYESEPSFRADIDACCDALAPHLGSDLRAQLFVQTGSDGESEAAARLTETRFAQPALFVIEYALAQLWMRWGIRPAALIGHSVGEYVAACLAGVFSLEDALALVASRGRLMQALPAGAMLAVPMEESGLTPLLGEDLSLAAVNGPALCVVSGPLAAIAAFEIALAARGLTARRLETSHAFHSAMMEPALDAFRAEVARVERHAPRVPFISNVTGTWITAAEATSPDYWTCHLRQPVLFSAGVQELLKESGRAFLEIGPGRTLASLVRQQGALAQGRTIVTTLRHPQETTSDLAGVLQGLGRLWLAGLAVDWPAFYATESRRRVPLPTYPFERRRYWIDAVQLSAKAAGGPPRRLVKNPDIASWFYVPSWARTALPRPDADAASASGPWLVFLDGEGLGERLVERLRSQGQTAVRVLPAERFASLDSQTYEVDARSAADYDALVGALRDAGALPRRIVHLWSVGAASSDFARAQDRGFYSVLYLAQAIGRQHAGGPLDLTIVGNQLRAVAGTDAIAPEKAPLLGLSLVIPQEYPYIRCGSVDVEPGSPAELSDLADRLQAELLAGPSGETIAYRGSQRWVQTPEPATIDGNAIRAAAGVLRERGVYLITGGFGNIGLAFADWLARTKRARLVLVGRSTPPARADWQQWVESHGPADRTTRQIEAVRALEALGAEVLVARADVANLEQMRIVVAHAREQFGALNGVIHAAGVVAAAAVATQSLDRDTCDAQFRPKIHGLYVLDQVTEGLDLDFVLLTSSLSSILGGLGFAAYAAVNQFLDSFAEQRTASGRRWISVNFDGWAFADPAATATSTSSSAAGELEMLPSEGVESVARIISDRSLTRVAVSTADLRARIDRYVRRAPVADAVATPVATRYARPEIATDFAAPIDEIEQVIAEVWQNLLGIDQIGRDDNFFDLGGHSLLLVQVHATLTEKLGRTLPVTDLFQYSTIATLAAHLGGAPQPRTRALPAVAPRVSAGASRPGESAGVAIVGMSGRFPGAPDVETFWANLRGGVESIEALSDDDLRRAGVDEQSLRNPRYVKATSQLDGVDLFDAAFFGYAPREADLLDPQQRLFLECAWEALERAGYDPKRYAGLIGVYAGASTNGYLANIYSNPELVQTVGVLQATMGSKSDHLPTRVSYKLNLRGPSMNVQTACSTSLVAVHQACRSLLDGECDMALAGGVSVSLGISGRAGYVYADEGILSPDGHCRAFDAQAQGTVWGDGVGVVVLKRLADALTDGDIVHAVILGTAINNDGSGKVGYTAPSVEGQAAVVARAQAVAGIDPATITYIEAHGTGTTLGDPIEVAALTQAFGPAAAGTCAIGTLKSNVGHLDAAAGVAGLIKTAMALEHAEIPPSLHFETPNPKIDFAGSPFFVNTALAPWASGSCPRRAGVSAFGIGGTNAHAVLEEAPPAAPSGPSRPWQVLVLSAQSRTALDAASVRLAERLMQQRDVNLADVAFTLQVGRQEFTHRRAVICRDVEDAIGALGKPAGPRTPQGVAPARPGSLAFLFPGQGAQHVDMARDLYRDEPIFRAVVDECAERLRQPLGLDLRSVIYPVEGGAAAAAEQLTQTKIAQPALFVIEYALATLWRAWGLEPRALLGHSIGEYVAACLAGVFTLNDALDLVAARGALMQQMPPGAMLAVMLPEDRLEPLLRTGDVSVAAVNGPALCVLAGPIERIDALEQELAGQDIRATRLHTSHAFHSAMMAPIVDRFMALVAGVAKQAPRVPFLSNVTGTWITDSEAIDPAYWSRHLLQPVRFADGVELLLQDPRRVLLEVGPGRTLAGLVKQHPACAADRLVGFSLRHPQQTESDLTSVLTALGHLWVGGLAIDWPRFHGTGRRRRVVLPTYPFERKRHWIAARAAEARPESKLQKADLGDWFYVPSWKQALSQTAIGPAAEIETRSHWVVFADGAGLGAHVVDHLARTGRDVVTVEPGGHFTQAAGGRYTIDPANSEHYAALFKSLKDTNRLPDTIAHFWGATSETPVEPVDSARCQQRGFFSLLYLAQALGTTGSSAPVRIGVVTTDVHSVRGDEPLCPAKATVLGPCRVIPAEYPYASCRAIDLVAAEWASADDKGIAQLVGEITAETADVVTAYRRGRRWVQTAEHTRLEATSNEEPSRFREGGVYLITGGVGGVGLTLAGHLARAVKAKLVLTSRRALPDRSQWAAHIEKAGDDDRVSRQIRAVEALEAAGGTVSVVAADVTNDAQIQAVVDHARKQYGRLDGVIHAAGVPGGGVIQLKTPDVASRVLAPKVTGTQALARALAGADLDFFVLCSSMTSLFGGGGQVDYCGANAYLDAFARHYSRQTGTFTVAINWDAWRDVGMAVDTTVPGGLSREREALLKHGISPDDGAEAFVRILAHGTSPQIAVSTVPLTALAERLHVAKGADEKPAGAKTAQAAAAPILHRHERPAIATDYAAPVNEIEREIAEVWQELLGIAQIGREDNFFDLGGHSLLLVQMHATLTARLDRELAVTDLFQFPTILSLAEHLVGRSGSGTTEAPQVVVAPYVRAAGATPNAVAIVSMAGRFPGAPDLDRFWTNLRDGVESIVPVSDDQLRQQGVDEALIGNPGYVKSASTLDGVDLFDASFFGYSPREAELLDPQQRLFLECAWEALELAGYDPRLYPGQIGVYAGASFNAYLANIFSNPEIVQAVGTMQAGMGTRGDYLPTRVSYKLNLRGPSINVQTACSTSLVAVHQACRSLVDGECDMALAGGASITTGMPGKTGYLYQEEGILSPDGHCRAFDAQAQGTVWGDGVGVVLLKRLADAIADGDTIHGVIRGTAINNDGAVKVGFTAPSVDGQAAVIARAQAVAGVEPASITYIEAHGTGTTLGDPIEVAALRQVFGAGEPGTCAIGTVKSNVGHLDAAAGVAGLIKATLALEHRQVPPSLHFEKPNPKIDFASSPFFVNTELRAWKTSGTPRRAGVSAFGMGGTNAHAVIEEAPAPPDASPSRALQLLVLSARTRGALDAATARLTGYLTDHPGASLADVAYTLQVGRRAFPHRRILVAPVGNDNGMAVQALSQADRAPVFSAAAETADRSCVFLFSGQGSQYPGMARDLYRGEPSFRADVDECCVALLPHLGRDLRKLLHAEEGTANAALLRQTQFTQPALFVIEYALARLWTAWGIRPAAMLGHSVGEYVAACLSGVFSLEDALALVAARGRLMQALPAGAMLAVPLAEGELTPLLGDALSLAAANGPAFCVASGPTGAIDELEKRLTARGVTARRLETSHAFHSAMMDPVLDAFTAEVAKIQRHAPKIPFISNVTGTWITAEQAADPQYWTRHLRQAVRFAAGSQELLKDPTRVFLEVGPGRTLASLVRQQGALAQGRTILTSLRHPQEAQADLTFVLQTLGRLWLTGLSVDWRAFSSAERRRRIPLPTYPFERQRFWIDARRVASAAPADGRGAIAPRPLVKNADIASWFYVPSWTRAKLAPQPVAENGAWLVFVQDEALCHAFIERLKQDGDTVVSVRVGDRFHALGQDAYELDPRAPGDYDMLMAELAGKGRFPRRIVHMWTLGPAPAALQPERAFTDAQDRGFYSVLFLTQALGRLGDRHTLDLAIVGDELRAVEGADIVSPDKSPVLGLCLTIPQEYPHITATTVDVERSPANGVVCLADLLYTELRTVRTGTNVAYRGAQRWVQAPSAVTVAADYQPALRERGVYLITGGLGRIGLAAAERLARDVRARLVLIGRSTPPPRELWQAWIDSHAADDRVSRQIAALRGMEDHGAEILVVAADVSNAEAVRAAVALAIERYGVVHGVIHAAGTLQGGVDMIQTLNREACELQFSPKVGGLYALEQATADLPPLDFWLLTSSLSALLGGLGYGAYAAANQFLDSFVESRALSVETRWISVDLDGWAFERGTVTTAVGALEMLPSEGVEALARILEDRSLTRVVVSTADIDARLDRYVRQLKAVDGKAEAPGGAFEGHERPELSTRYTPPTTELECALCDIWQELLGIDRIGIHDDFFELGGHSLLATQIASRVRERCAIELSLRDFLEAATVARLAESGAAANRAPNTGVHTGGERGRREEIEIA